MNQVQQEKLKLLVNSSTILSPAERSEWLALLDLMNDKQLDELEKILVSDKGQRTRDKQIQQATGNRQQGSGPSVLAKPVASQLGAQTQMPKLSHIMNLPNLGSSASGFKPQPAPVLKPQPAPEVKKKSAFAEKLKMLFTEKELPAGQPDAVKELSSEAKILPKNTAPAPKILPAPLLPKPLASPQPLPTPVTQKVSSSGSNNRPSIISEPAAALRPVKAATEIDRPDITEKIQREILASVKSSAPVTAGSSNAQQSVNLNLEELSDLAAIDNKLFQASDFEQLVAKIRKLVKKHGYFEVIFNLEKSPLYQNYISTGQEVLSKGTGFEQLSYGSKGFLNRQQFEKLADLLRQIQVA